MLKDDLCKGEENIRLTFTCELVRVIDGDTVIVDITNIRCPGLFNIVAEPPITLLNQRVRLFGIDAPEIYGKEKFLGYASKHFLELCIKKEELLIEIHHRFYEKYGRLIGTILITNYSTPDINVNQLMVSEGYAYPATYVRGKYVRTTRPYSSHRPPKTFFPFA
jgi:endonuclease YncB( thermonuclease family)